MKPAARVRCFISRWPEPKPFSGNGIDHFVMAITAAKATAWHIASRQMA